MAGTHIDITGDDRRLQDAINRSNRSIDEFTNRVDKSNTSATQGQNALGNAISNTTKGISFMGLTGSVAIGGTLNDAFIKVLEIVKQLISSIKEFVNEGVQMATQAEGVERAFKSLGNPDLLKGLREQTKGTINDFELMKAAVKASNFGIPAEKLGGLLKFAQQTAAATGQSVDYLVDSIVTGLGRKSIMILDNLQINVAELQKRVASGGDFMSAAIEMVNEKLKEQGDLALTAADKEQIAAAKRENAQIKIGNSLLGVKNIFSELTASIYETLSNLIERYLPPLMKRIETTANSFIDWYNSSLLLRGVFASLYLNGSLFFNKLELAVKNALDGFNALAKVGKAVFNLDYTSALMAGMEYQNKMKDNFKDFVKDAAKSAKESVSLTNKELDKIDITSKLASGGSKTKSKNTKDELTDQEKERMQKMRNASLKLINLQAELDNETVKQKLDHEQKILDLEQDSFDKRERQNQLNLLKEFQTIEEYRQKIAKAQQDAAKDIHISKTGSETGFNFATFNMSLLPDGLKPSDVEAQVNRLTSAALEAWKNGNKELAKERQSFADEERLTFASQLDQQIYSIRKHYQERRQLAEGDSKAILLINSNELKEIRLARLAAKQRQLQSDADFKEKEIELSDKFYLFASDKDADLLKEKIKNNKELIKNYKEQFKELSGKNFDLLSKKEIEKYTEAFPEIVNQIKGAIQETKKFEKDWEKLTTEERVEAVAGWVNQLTDALHGTNKELSTTVNLANDVYQGFKQGSWIGAAVAFASNMISFAVNKSAEEAKIRWELVKIQDEYNISLRQQNYDLISAIDYASLFKDNLEALQWMVDRGMISNVDYTEWEALNKQLEIAEENGKIAGDSFDKLEDKVKGILTQNYLIRNMKGYEKFKPILEDWYNGTIKEEEALRRLSAVGFNGFTEMADQMSRARDEADKWKDEIIELNKQLGEMRTGMSFDDARNDLASFLRDTDKTMADVADNFEEYMRNAIVNSLVFGEFNNSIEDWYADFSARMADKTLSEEDKKALRDKYNQIYQDAINKRNELLDAAGLDIDTPSVSATSKGIAAVSQDSFNEYLGTANATLNKAAEILNVSKEELSQMVSINNGMFDMQAIMRENQKIIQDSLNVQIQIERNTFRTADLLSKGIVVNVRN
ncbi:hypothetical protein [Dysgonomonas sp. Marseille-P4677]|uniref:hypothetical protein n=1 Tax=Dysgonomonas sp. Marseille-P4677 TaxID=2364790 RepID=UPI001F3DEE5E|nr:hypothetical protein [Dysgonomonas sp. Marseille-P4677]